MTDRWSAIERLFHAALAQPIEARAGFLAGACGDDVELRREVQSLLDQASAPGFMEQPALHVAAGLLTAASLAPLTGQQIGVYSITALLGRGGMGEVYRARDTRLGRDVAIKVLPRAVTTDPERLKRFEREARMLALLNHPHIGMLYGLEESGGHVALVLELVEGDTLADRVARGPVPVEQALMWARQIADALDAAHERGIVHRDLKPANVMVTRQDVVKVLDFGLARTFEDGIAGDQPHAPTITTEGAAIVGTAAYMSPEQARGQVVDKRADVWAFGCVLFELLTGRAAFRRGTVTDTLAAVLQEQPDWSALPATLPSSVTALLPRCLDKDVRRRRRDIGDVRAELDEALAQLGTAPVKPAGTTTPSPVRHGGRTLLAVAAVAMAAALLALSGRWLMSSRPPDPAEARVTRLTDAVGIEEMPAVSPDGRDLAFVQRVNGRRQIWVRRLTGGHPLQMTFDDVDHTDPRWTPDSSAIVYFTPPVKEGDAGALYEIPALKGEPTRLAASSSGADVSHEGQLATFQKNGEGMSLVILSRDGGAPLTMVPVAAEATDFHPPRWSPDGRSIAYYYGRGGWRYVLFVMDVATLESKQVNLTATRHIKGVTWLPDGHSLVFASADGSTMVYPPTFNLRLVAREGGRERQLTIGDASYEQPDIGRTGQFYATRTLMRSDLWRFPVTGSAPDNVRNATRITEQTGHVQTPSVSPDDSEIAYLSDSGGHSNVWVARVDGAGNPRPLTAERDPRVIVGIPVWSPANDLIAFIRDDTRNRDPTGGFEWLINRDGSERRRLGRGASAAWSPDGRWLYYQTQEPGQPEQCVSKVLVDGTNPPVPVRCGAAVPAPASDGTLYFSPGGFWNANEIYKAKPEHSGAPVLVTRYARSRVPLWPTGLALSPDERWLAVPLTDGATTNIWAIPTDGGPYRQITDFGRRPALIARQVSWSRSGRFIFAAVTERDSDIVVLEGIAPSRE